MRGGNRREGGRGRGRGRAWDRGRGEEEEDRLREEEDQISQMKFVQHHVTNHGLTLWEAGQCCRSAKPQQMYIYDL